MFEFICGGFTGSLFSYFLTFQCGSLFEHCYCYGDSNQVESKIDRILHKLDEIKPLNSYRL